MTDLKFTPTRQPLVLFVPRLTVVNIPQTTTLLALGFFTSIFLWPPFLAFIAVNVPTEYAEEVVKTGQFLRDAMLFILGFYFAKVVNAGQEHITNKAIDSMAASAAAAPATPPTAPPPMVQEEEGNITRG